MKNEIAQNENRLPSLPSKASSAAKPVQQGTPNRIIPDLVPGTAHLNQTIRNETIVREQNGPPASNPYS